MGQLAGDGLEDGGIDTFPCSRSHIAGIICARTGIPSQIERIRRRLACGASAIVTITWSIPGAVTSVGSASVDPSTFSPPITGTGLGRRGDQHRVPQSPST